MFQFSVLVLDMKCLLFNDVEEFTLVDLFLQKLSVILIDIYILDLKLKNYILFFFKADGFARLFCIDALE